MRSEFKWRRKPNPNKQWSEFRWGRGVKWVSGRGGIKWVLMKGKWNRNWKKIKEDENLWTGCASTLKWEVKGLLLAYGQLCFSGLCDKRIWKKGMRKWTRVAKINSQCSVSEVGSTILVKSGHFSWVMWLGLVAKKKFLSCWVIVEFELWVMSFEFELWVLSYENCVIPKPNEP